MSNAVADWVNIELTALFDECANTPLDEEAHKKLEKLNNELREAIAANRYPLSAMFEIAKIYRHGGEK